MTPIITPTTFPLDGILTCGECGCAMALQHNPLPRYACQSGCAVPALKAIEINHLAFTTVFEVLASDHMREQFSRQIQQAFTEYREQEPAAGSIEPPTVEGIRRLLADPQAILNHELMPDARAALCQAMNRMEVHGNTATINYAMPVPQGDQPRQTVQLPPEMVAA